jgi:hypothetical protein
MKKPLMLAAVLTLCAGPALADVVADWNTRTLQASAAGARRGPSGLLDLPMVHLAMHDAVQAYERRYAFYCAAVPDPAGSPVAAAAAAAHGVLQGLFPAQAAALATTYDTLTAQYIQQGLMVAGDPGAAVGQQAAACLLGRLQADNAARSKPDSFVGGTAIGQWQPTVPAGPNGPVPMLVDFMAGFTPFTLNSPSQFRTANAPPALWSGAYAKAYNEVKAKGAATNSTRTQQETDIARFYSDGPPNYWNRLLRELVVTRALDVGDSARMFALVNVAMADAVIAAWDNKIAWNYWRPVTAIRNGDADGNPNTAGDAGWSSYVAAPNYPDYTSGANSLAGAASAMLENLTGSDELSFTLHSNTAPPSPAQRSYTRLSDAVRDVVDARIYMGIHFRFADTVAVRQGRHVANWAFGHFLRPLQ